MTFLTSDEIEALPVIETELRFTCMVYCPDCPEEFEENPGALEDGNIVSCPKCSFKWMHRA